LAELRTAIAVLERSKESQDAALKGHQASLEQLEGQIAAKDSRVAELTKEADDLESAIATLTGQVEELSGQLGGLSADIGPAEEELAALEIEQRRLEGEEAEGRKALQDYEAAYNKSLLERQRREDELRNLQDRIEADLEMVAVSTDWPRQLPLDIDARLKSLPMVMEIPQGLEAKTKELRRRLRGMGPVNLEAPVEYQEVLERHSFLMSQVEDLEKATESLRKVVAELDRLMEDKFLETFNKVAMEFEIYFTRLFNGGRGQLVLTEPQNPLQSGVEILAQPPGQRRGSIAMLSGGQRALTGVALTFAILKACDTPFCLLDEVDARLDEVNVGRFREALKELAEGTQVIIITHNRITLESADTIYGITMAGDSTSRVLSLRLEEVEAKVS
jgi:chromosome segregation protein